MQKLVTIICFFLVASCRASDPRSPSSAPSKRAIMRPAAIVTGTAPVVPDKAPSSDLRTRTRALAKIQQDFNFGCQPLETIVAALVAFQGEHSAQIDQNNFLFEPGAETFNPFDDLVRRVKFAVIEQGKNIPGIENLRDERYQDPMSLQQSEKSF